MMPLFSSANLILTRENLIESVVNCLFFPRQSTRLLGHCEICLGFEIDLGFAAFNTLGLERKVSDWTCFRFSTNKTAEWKFRWVSMVSCWIAMPFLDLCPNFSPFTSIYSYHSVFSRFDFKLNTSNNFESASVRFAGYHRLSESFELHFALKTNLKLWLFTFKPLPSKFFYLNTWNFCSKAITGVSSGIQRKPPFACIYMWLLLHLVAV